MTKQIINIVEFPILHDILDEINSLLSFKIINYQNSKEFLKSEKLNDVTLLKKNNHQLLSSKTVNIKNLILIDDVPIKLEQLLNLINIRLIKKKYDFQSQLNIKNYSLNLIGTSSIKIKFLIFTVFDDSN